jgi:hypothetical protein
VGSELLLLLDVVIPDNGRFNSCVDDATVWSVTKAVGDTEGVEWVFLQTALPLRVDADDYVMLHPATQDPKAPYDAPWVRTPCLLPRACRWAFEGPPGAKIQLWGTKLTAIPQE